MRARRSEGIHVCIIKNEKIFDMKRILFLVLLLVATTGAYGQKFAVKSNLLYDATATINLGVEVVWLKNGRWIYPATIMDGSLVMRLV